MSTIAIMTETVISSPVRLSMRAIKVAINIMFRTFKTVHKLLYLFQLLSLLSVALSYHILITHFSLKKIIKEILNTYTSLSYNTPRRKKKMTLIVIGILALCAIPAVYTIKNYMNEN